MSKAPHIETKTATLEDAQNVRRLVREAYEKWVPVLGREPLPMTADYELAIAEHEIELLYADRQLIALIELIIAPDHLFIENVAVAPESQGQGFGRQLLSQAEQKARKLGLTELRLLTNGAFEANIRLYQFLGFHIDRTEPFMGSTAVHMIKDLNVALPATDDRDSGHQPR